MVRLIIITMLFNIGSGAYGSIVDQTLLELFEIASPAPKSVTARLGKKEMLSCAGLEGRINKIKKYNRHVQELEEQMRRKGYQGYLAHRETLNYLAEELDDFYIRSFDESRVEIALKHTPRKGEFVVATFGGSSRIHFPSGASDFDVRDGEMFFSVSNYVACRSDSIRVFIVKNCEATSLFDYEICSNPKVKAQEVASPRPIVRDLPGRRLGGLE